MNKTIKKIIGNSLFLGLLLSGGSAEAMQRLGKGFARVVGAMKQAVRPSLRALAPGSDFNQVLLSQGSAATSVFAGSDAVAQCVNMGRDLKRNVDFSTQQLPFSPSFLSFTQARYTSLMPQQVLSLAQCRTMLPMFVSPQVPAIVKEQPSALVPATKPVQNALVLQQQPLSLVEGSVYRRLMGKKKKNSKKSKTAQAELEAIKRPLASVPAAAEAMADRPAVVASQPSVLVPVVDGGLAIQVSPKNQVPAVKLAVAKDMVPAQVEDVAIVPVEDAQVPAVAEQHEDRLMPVKQVADVALATVAVKDGALVPTKNFAVKMSQSQDRTISFMHIPAAAFRALGRTIIYDNADQPYALLSFGQSSNVQKLIDRGQDRLALPGGSTALAQVSSSSLRSSDELRRTSRLIAQALQVKENSVHVDMEQLQEIAHNVHAQQGSMSVSLVQPGKAGQSMVLQELPGKARYVMTPHERYVLVPLNEQMVQNWDKIKLPNVVTLAFQDQQVFSQQPALPAGHENALQVFSRSVLPSLLPARPNFLVERGYAHLPVSVRGQARHVVLKDSRDQVIRRETPASELSVIHDHAPVSVRGRARRVVLKDSRDQVIRRETPASELSVIHDHAPVSVRGQARHVVLKDSRDQVVRRKTPASELSVIHDHAPVSVRGQARHVVLKDSRDQVIRRETPASELSVIHDHAPVSVRGRGHLTEVPRGEIVRVDAPESELAVRVDQLPEVRRGDARELERPRLQRAQLVRARRVDPPRVQVVDPRQDIEERGPRRDIEERRDPDKDLERREDRDHDVEKRDVDIERVRPVPILRPIPIRPIPQRIPTPIPVPVATPDPIPTRMPTPDPMPRQQPYIWNGDNILRSMLATLASHARLALKRRLLSRGLQGSIFGTLAEIQASIVRFLHKGGDNHLSPELVQEARRSLENSRKVS